MLFRSPLLLLLLFFSPRRAGGEVLIERHLRPTPHPRSVCDFFWSVCQKTDSNFSGGGDGSSAGAASSFDPSQQSKQNIPPVMQMYSTGIYIVSIFRDSLIFLATLQLESPPLLVIEFLHLVANTFGDYFGSPVTDELVKDNFSTVYQLLDEMCDNGHPLTTEPNALQAMIAPPTVMGKVQQFVTGSASLSSSLPESAISSIPWRRANVSYAQNEIYVDLVEELDAIIDAKGRVVSSDINGSIQCQSKLSGVPDLTLTFRDPKVIDDCSFHPCVRFGRYEREQVISFVPPDGNFELMRYRVKNLSGFVDPPIFCTPQLSFGSEGEGGDTHTKGNKKVDGRINVLIGVKQSSSLVFPGQKGPMIIEDVVVTIPFPSVVRTANLTVTAGTCLYDEATKVALWTIPKMDKSVNPQLTGTMLLTGSRPEESPPLQLDWKIPMASVSGLSVSGLSVVNEGYKPYKGVRTITKSGRFTVRCL